MSPTRTTVCRNEWRERGPRTMICVRRILLGVALLVLTGVVACGGSSGDTGVSSAPESSARLLEPAEFAAAIEEPDRVMVNVHVPFEGALPNTDLEIPFDQIAQRRSQLPDDRSTPLAVYCMSGNMSAQATQTLTELGYTDIVDLDGGMKAWEASGRVLDQKRTG